MCGSSEIVVIEIYIARLRKKLEKDTIVFFVKEVLFRRVFILWLIQSKYHIGFDVDEPCLSWIKCSLWCNTTICRIFHVLFLNIFCEFITIKLCIGVWY